MKQLYVIKLSDGKFYSKTTGYGVELDAYPDLEVEPWASLVAKRVGGKLKPVKLVLV